MKVCNELTIVELLRITRFCCSRSCSLALSLCHSSLQRVHKELSLHCNESSSREKGSNSNGGNRWKWMMAQLRRGRKKHATQHNTHCLRARSFFIYLAGILRSARRVITCTSYISAHASTRPNGTLSKFLPRCLGNVCVCVASKFARLCIAIFAFQFDLSAHIWRLNFAILPASLRIVRVYHNFIESSVHSIRSCIYLHSCYSAH